MARQPVVHIEYCVLSNYAPRAAELASAIETEFGLKPQLVEGSGTVFEVRVDGKLIYSKRATGRFPESDEIFFHVKQAAEVR